MSEQPTFDLTITVKITDPQALHKAAVQQMKLEVPSFTDEDVIGQLGTAEEPYLGACLQAVGDPGVSWIGTEILHSHAEDRSSNDYFLGNL